MKRYRSTFRQTTGEAFPPKFVNAKIRCGALRCNYRGPAGGGTITGARVVRAGIVEVSSRFWDQYFALRHGKPPLPVEDGVEPAEKGALIPGNWDCLIAHYKAH